MSTTTVSESLPDERLQSLDLFRGLTMFLLIAEATSIYELMAAPGQGSSILAAVGTQFHHHPWNGLRFWDLVQPFFMFIVGVAMPFSFGRRWARGETWGSTFGHALRRSALLLFLGWALYCIGPGHLTFELWNVLAQLSVTFLVAFLMMKRPIPVQIAFTLGLLVLTELLYRLWAVPGFNQPFVPDHNFGSWVDLKLMGKLSEGHWVAFNAIPTTAHTMWGVLAGRLLLSRKSPGFKVRTLVLVGALGIAAGFALSPVTPIIKRICTSSFVIVSGGWCLLTLGLSYGLVDVLKVRKWSRFFAIVGMNPLFIYLFTESGGAEWLHRIAKPFTLGLFGWTGDWGGQVATSLAVLALLWLMCYGLYRKRIFIRI